VSVLFIKEWSARFLRILYFTDAQQNASLPDNLFFQVNSLDERVHGKLRFKKFAIFLFL